MKRVYSSFNWIDEEEKIAPYKLLLDRYPNSKFIWMDAYEYEHDIDFMETPHLYYTIRMIWNHLCIKELVLDTKTDYDFSGNPVYCNEYFIMGIQKMFKELLTRKDLSINFYKNIEFIKEHMNEVI